MNHLAKPLVMGLTAICATTGVLYAALTISTDPATHDAFLHTLSLGDKDSIAVRLRLKAF